MPIGASDRIEMNQRERDTLNVLKAVLSGQRSQAEAALLLRKSVRQVRRLLAGLREQGDRAVVHGLRGQPSNRKASGSFRASVLDAYRTRYPDFGPALACEKLAAEGLHVGRETLRRWLCQEGLWLPHRRRDPHRSRRPRRGCFGELVQFDASFHDWFEGRGQPPVLIAGIDDATSRVLARFYSAATVETHMDLLGLWLRQFGRPLAWYTDRHSIFEPQGKGRAVTEVLTQFGRALSELGIELIRAHSPQAKGRVERLFGTAQDRWVKEMRLARVSGIEQANELLSRKILPGHNRAFAKAARQAGDAHRELGPCHDLGAILSLQWQRTVSNDYVVRFANRFYQLLPPALPGLRGGKVIVEERIDGSLKIRFGKHYPKHKEITRAVSPGGPTPRPPEFSASAADASGEGEGPAPSKGGRAGVQPPAGRSGCTPAEPYPPDGEKTDSARPKYRPGQNHPWWQPYKQKK